MQRNDEVAGHYQAQGAGSLKRVLGGRATSSTPTNPTPYTRPSKDKGEKGKDDRTDVRTLTARARMGQSTGHGEQPHRIENEKGAQSEQHHGEYPHRVEGPPNEVRLSCRASLTISQIEHYHSKTAPPASGAC